MNKVFLSFVLALSVFSNVFSATNIPGSGPNPTNLKMEVDGSGNSLVVWIDQTEGKAKYSYKTVTGFFSAPIVLGNAITPQYGYPYLNIDLAFDSNGNALIVWAQDANTVAYAYVAKGASNFEAIQTITITNIERVQVVAAPSGSFLALFGSSIVHSSFQTLQWAERPQGGSQSFGSLSQLDNLSDGLSLSSCSVAFDNENNAIAVWSQNTIEGSQPTILKYAFKPANQDFQSPVSILSPGNVSEASYFSVFYNSTDSVYRWFLGWLGFKINEGGKLQGIVIDRSGNIVKGPAVVGSGGKLYDCVVKQKTNQALYVYSDETFSKLKLTTVDIVNLSSISRFEMDLGESRIYLGAGASVSGLGGSAVFGYSLVNEGDLGLLIAQNTNLLRGEQRSFTLVPNLGTSVQAEYVIDQYIVSKVIYSSPFLALSVWVTTNGGEKVIQYGAIGASFLEFFRYSNMKMQKGISPF